MVSHPYNRHVWPSGAEPSGPAHDTSEEKLKKSLDEPEILAKEMSHRVKNVFAIADGLIRVSARNAASKEELAENLYRQAESTFRCALACSPFLQHNR